MVNASDPVSIWSLGAPLGEGPVWVEQDQALWFVDIKSHRIHRLDPANGEKRSWDAPGQCGFVLPAATGGFVAGLQQGLALFDPADGSFTPLVDPEPDLPGNRLNDGTVDPEGRLWFGTMDDGESQASGRFYRLASDGRTVAVAGPCPITNGPAISPDGRTLYHVDTLYGVIHACAIGADGMLNDSRELVRLDTRQGHPDGPAVDAEGCLWVGIYGGGCVRRYSPQGELLQSIPFPVDSITKVAFGGPDRMTVYATTACKHLSDEQRGQQPHAGDLFSFTVDVPGQPGYEIREGLTGRASG